MKVLFVMVREENIDPLNVELLSALAKREGHETFLNVLEHKDLEDQFTRLRPDLVAFSAKTGESNVMFRANGLLRERFGTSYRSIMGGPHVTFNHRRMRLLGEDAQSPAALPARAASAPTAAGTSANLPPEDTKLDFLCVGEADDSWPALLNTLARGDSADAIPNIVTRGNRRPDGTVALNERTNFLDDLPFHDRELVYERTQLKHFGMRTFIATRGCPYPCTYCFNAKFNEIYRRKGKTINRYSVDRLLEELVEIKRTYPTQFIKFYDDIFALRVDDWLEEFAEKYPKVVGLPFHCLTRCDLVHKDPKIIDVMKKAGLHSITMSIESGNDFIRKHVMKRGMEEEHIRFAFRYCEEKGIKTFSNTILAVPAPVIPGVGDPAFEAKAKEVVEHLDRHFRIKTDEVRKELELSDTLPPAGRRAVYDRLHAIGLRESFLDYDREGLDINVDCRVTSGEFVTLAPYPGTPLTDYTIAMGAFDGDYEKLNETFQAESPFTCFTPEEKREQLNIVFLGVPLLVFPGFTKFAEKHLIPRRWLTPVYFLLYFFVRGYVLGVRIYPMRYSWKQLLGKAKSSFTREVMKHFAVRQQRAQARKRPVVAPATDVLGGPWSG